jgi:hypothetical protein
MVPKNPYALAQREMLVGKRGNGGVERSVSDRYRPGRRDNPSNMLCVPVPQLNTVGHVRGKVVQVRIGQLAQQSIDAMIERR